jgi:hypothetical protein
LIGGARGTVFDPFCGQFAPDYAVYCWVLSENVACVLGGSSIKNLRPIISHLFVTFQKAKPGLPVGNVQCNICLILLKYNSLQKLFFVKSSV